jgi:hypothetical protein
LNISTNLLIRLPPVRTCMIPGQTNHDWDRTEPFVARRFSLWSTSEQL